MTKNTVNTLVLRQITAQETYRVRHAVLRKGKPIESCVFEGDDLATTFHIGGFVSDKLVAVASFYKKKNEKYSFSNAAQLRGMAVLGAYHGCGYGQQLLLYSEQLLTEKKVHVLWMNARIAALGFYSKLNYQTIGTVFDIPKVGEHFVMFKKM
tara:strand:- start:33071 stop:33529 length:459 start_codon:yes stop_codon:yes gene_type:complete